MSACEVLLALLLATASTAPEAPSSPSPPPGAINSTRVIVAPGVSLRVLETDGPAKLPPLVLIPGWSAGAGIWKGQIEHFAGSRRVIALDPRSQGESTKVTFGNTPETRANDLHAVFEARGIARPVLVGWSQGVQDVAAYVARYGSRDLSGIVLVDSTISAGARNIVSAPANAAGTFQRLAVYQARQEDYLRGMFGFIISKPQSKAMTDELVATGLKTPPAIGAAMLVADLYGEDRSAALDAVSVPLLVIAAANSPELEAQRAMAGRIPGARFEVIDDASHAVFIDQPERFRSVLATFLEEVR
jgi:microsomal epoxide hydrolase